MGFLLRKFKMKKKNDEFVKIQNHLSVLQERTRRLKSIIRKRNKEKYYNKSEAKKLLSTIKKAKLNVANAEFI